MTDPHGPSEANRRPSWRPPDGAAVLRAGLLGLLVAAYAALVYLGAIVAATAVGGGAMWLAGPPAWLSALAIAVVGATLPPVWRWLKAGVDGVVYGADDDTAAVLARLHAVLRAAGHAPAASLSRRDEARLADIARQLGAVLYAEALTADVRAARERLVAAREEERRRIRNDLHDGLGPMLAALQLQLDALPALVAAEPGAAAGRIDVLRAQLRMATAEIRRLVDGLRPPALDALGLVGAVRQLAEAAGGAVDVEAPEALPALPAAVEVAAYRIVAEALHNVRRHAGGAPAAVHVGLAGDALCIEIVDGGPGMAGDRPAGVGTASMAERAAELRGTLVIDRAPGGGTRVVATLPLALDSPPAPPEPDRWTP